MQYVASHTTIPVPKVYAVHAEKDGSIYIEMAYVRGGNLDSTWDDLSTDQRKTVFADIKTAQPPSQDIVCSALQKPAYMSGSERGFFGPVNHDEFHSLVRKHLHMEDVAPFLGPESAQVHTSRYQTHFARADLAPRNVLVRAGRVAAILDWELAGWYPEYWGFTKAHYNHFPGQGWEEYLRLVLPCYETELTAEETLWRKLPEPGAELPFLATELATSGRARARQKHGWMQNEAAS